MSFDIHQRVLDESGELDEEASACPGQVDADGRAFRQALMERVNLPGLSVVGVH